ncbi:MAG: redoxin domain-containing protein [Gemmatimonadetes bacterium]|nr:redoxin domain-containing protein [Gemmatimonadota bacterium]
MSELAAGTKAPAFSLPGLGGGNVGVPTGASLTCVVVFKSSCPTCRWALPYFQALHAGTKNGPLAVIGIAEDEPAEARALAEDLALDFPIALEGEPWATSEAYECITVPTMFLLDGDDRVILTSPGFARDDMIEVARRTAEIAGGDPFDPFGGKDMPPFRPG